MNVENAAMIPFVGQSVSKGNHPFQSFAAKSIRPPGVGFVDTANRALNQVLTIACSTVPTSAVRVRIIADFNSL